MRRGGDSLFRMLPHIATNILNGCFQDFCWSFRWATSCLNGLELASALNWLQRSSISMPAEMRRQLSCERQTARLT